MSQTNYFQQAQLAVQIIRNILIQSACGPMCRMDSRKEARSPSTVEEERNSVKGEGEFKRLGMYGG
jgi:hypothetical protein